MLFYNEQLCFIPFNYYFFFFQFFESEFKTRESHDVNCFELHDVNVHVDHRVNLKKCHIHLAPNQYNNTNCIFVVILI